MLAFGLDAPLDDWKSAVEDIDRVRDEGYECCAEDRRTEGGNELGESHSLEGNALRVSVDCGTSENAESVDVTLLLSGGTEVDLHAVILSAREDMPLPVLDVSSSGSNDPETESVELTSLRAFDSQVFCFGAVESDASEVAIVSARGICIASGSAGRDAVTSSAEYDL